MWDSVRTRRARAPSVKQALGHWAGPASELGQAGGLGWSVICIPYWPELAQEIL